MNDRSDQVVPNATEEAKLNPGGWLYKIVGDYGPDDAIPPYAIEGAWRIDVNGKATGAFIKNPNFRPSRQQI